MNDLWQGVDDSTFNFIGTEQSNSNVPASNAVGNNSSALAEMADPVTESSTPAVPPEEGALMGPPESNVAGAEEGISERDKILCLLSHFDRDQLDRYEMFRRAAFPKSVIRMIMQSVSGRPVSQNAVIAMAGITKVYIGEIVEEALRFQDQQIEASKLLGLDSSEELGGGRPESLETATKKDPLKPSHIYEAVRRLKDKIIQKRPLDLRL